MLQRQGGTHTRRCTHKAEHIKGGLWPPQESCYLRVVWGLAPASSEASRSKGLVGAPKARWYTLKAVHTQGGAHKRWSVATAGVLLFMGGARAAPRIERSEPKQGVCIRVGFTSRVIV